MGKVMTFGGSLSPYGGRGRKVRRFNALWRCVGAWEGGEAFCNSLRARAYVRVLMVKTLSRENCWKILPYLPTFPFHARSSLPIMRLRHLPHVCFTFPHSTLSFPTFPFSLHRNQDEGLIGPNGTTYRKGDLTMAARRSRDAVRDWMAREDAAVEAVKAAAMPPETASPSIIAAPARGPQLVAPQFETVQTPSGPRARRATADGFHPVRRADAFDVMALQHKRAGGKGATFTVGQVEAGRAYAALTERVASEGVRCSSPEARQGGGGEAVDWIEGVIARSSRLERMRIAIGDGLVLDHAGDNGKRKVIRVRDLVDAVCIKGCTIGQVLRAHGWSAKGESRSILRHALADALDRISLR